MACPSSASLSVMCLLVPASEFSQVARLLRVRCSDLLWDLDSSGGNSRDAFLRLNKVFTPSRMSIMFLTNTVVVVTTRADDLIRLDFNEVLRVDGSCKTAVRYEA